MLRKYRTLCVRVRAFVCVRAWVFAGVHVRVCDNYRMLRA